MKKNIMMPLMACSLLGFGTNSYAALVTQNMTGDFTFVDEAVVGGIASLSSIIGATVSATVTYDDALVAPVGPSFVELDSGGGQGLTIDIGSLSFTEADDLDYGFGFPSANFTDGEFTSFDFLYTHADNWDLIVTGTGFTIMDYSTPLDITVAQGTFTVSQVPVPAAVWLFGSGLLGFITIARRKHA